MNSSLQNEILRIPPEQRFFTGKGARLLDYYCNDACVFGYGTYSNVAPLSFIPPETKGLYFYYGAGIKDLLEEILKLDLVNNLECMAIGITHNNANDYADYSEISKLLSNSHFPKLRFFEYGVDELIANEHCIYGNLGNITDVLGNMPGLEKLYLYGNFELTKPLDLPQLADLEVLMDDYVLHINGGKISNETLQKILSSDLESIQILSLYMDFNDQNYDYSIPETFLSGQHMSKLKMFELQGKFKTGTKTTISKSEFLNNSTIKLDISGLKEPNI